MTVSRAEIERGLDDVTRPFLALLTTLHAAFGGVTEIRIIRRKVIWAARIAAGDVDGLVAALRPLGDTPREVIPTGDHPRSGEGNIYFALGAVRPDPAWPTGQPIRRAKTTAKDADILAYPWAVVDVDPERDPKDRSASDAEKAEALAITEAVRAELAGLGVQLARADSGNGYHLLARHEGAPGATVKDAAKRMKALLHSLHARFSTAGAKVDISTHNPGRIMKLYGTVATKGEDTEAAPHRLSWLDVTTIPAPMDVFAAVAEPEPEPAAKSEGGKAKGPRAQASRETPAQRAWRSSALAALDLSRVYGEWLTGKVTASGWLECRDPDSPSGDQDPSAGVADTAAGYERGRFHTFRRSEGMSVFDFLVARGRARDFADARRLVADLSGVPLHPTREAGAPTLDAFAAGWAAATDASARSALLEAAVRAALALPSVASAEALERLRDESGVTPAVLRGVAAQVKKALRREQRRERAARPEPTRPGIPVVEYVTDADTMEALFDKLLGVIEPLNRFFQHGNDLVFVKKGRGPIRLNDQNLPGVLSSFLELALMHQEEDGVAFDRYDVLPTVLARAFLASPRVGHRLPVLTSYVRSPVFDKEWNFIATFGFHAASGIFYDGPLVRPGSGDAAIRRAVDDFKWKAEADRVNFIGALLTGLTMPLWALGHPFLAINGNKPGVGKSTLATVLAVVTEGEVPSAITLTANDEEFEKQIATRVEAGDRTIIVDNAKATGAISSAVLERSITAPKLNFRRLGSNTSISRPENDVLFVLTMNVTQLCADLRRRAMPVNLYIEGNVRNVPYAADELVREVLAARLDILAELAGMVLAWVDAGKPLGVTPARHSTNQRWAATIDGVLQHAGLEGFLTNLAESEHAFDEDYDALRDVCAAHHGEGFHTPGEWAPILLAGALTERLRDARGNPKSAKSQETTVGMLFRSYIDDTLVTDAGTFVVTAREPHKGRSVLYGFVPQE